MENKEIRTIKNNEGKEIPVIDSREVAEMLGKEHKYILRYIEGADGVVGILPTLESAGLHSPNYFIPSTYKAGTKEYKCYLVTKMGCELLGNKQQGENGILFSAQYVERFNKMEDYIKNGNLGFDPELLFNEAYKTTLALPDTPAKVRLLIQLNKEYHKTHITSDPRKAEDIDNLFENIEKYYLLTNRIGRFYNKQAVIDKLIIIGLTRSAAIRCLKEHGFVDKQVCVNGKNSRQLLKII